MIIRNQSNIQNKYVKTIKKNNYEKKEEKVILAKKAALITVAVLMGIKFCKNSKTIRNFCSRFFNLLSSKFPKTGNMKKPTQKRLENHIKGNDWNNITIVHRIRTSTKENLEDSLKGVDLHNPADIQAALERIPGTRIRPGVFHPSPTCASGQKVYITLQDGTKLILESHTDSRGQNPILRLYENIRDKASRDYLLPNGLFGTNLFRSPEAHIPVSILNNNWSGIA